MSETNKRLPEALKIAPKARATEEELNNNIISDYWPVHQRRVEDVTLSADSNVIR